MSFRPTPGDIICHHTASLDSAGEVDAAWTETLLDALTDHGYVIVHPDDVVEHPWSTDSGYVRGWKRCRCVIFGGEA